MIYHESPPCNIGVLQQYIETIASTMIPPLKEQVELKAYIEKLAAFADVFYAKQEEKLCGCCAVYLNQAVGYITSIGIYPECQGMGIGNMLLENVLKEAKKQNIDQIELEVFQGNGRAINFYKKCGFSIIKKHGMWIRMRKKI